MVVQVGHCTRVCSFGKMGERSGGSDIASVLLTKLCSVARACLGPEEEVFFLFYPKML